MLAAGQPAQAHAWCHVGLSVLLHEMSAGACWGVPLLQQSALAQTDAELGCHPQQDAADILAAVKATRTLQLLGGRSAGASLKGVEAVSAGMRSWRGTLCCVLCPLALMSVKQKS